MTKKIITTILAIILIAAMMPTVAFAAETPEEFRRRVAENSIDAYVADTISSWANDAVFGSYVGQETIGMFNNYKADISRLDFITTIMTWVEVSTGIDSTLQYQALTQPIFAEFGWWVMSTAGQLEAGATNITLSYANGTDGAYTAQAARLTAAMFLGLTDGQNLYNSLTREQAATMIMRAVTLVNKVKADGMNYIETSVIQAPINAPTATFNDMAQVSSWAVGGVNFVAANGIMQGSGGNFSPRQNLTVEMAIVLINNIDLDRIKS